MNNVAKVYCFIATKNFDSVYVFFQGLVPLAVAEANQSIDLSMITLQTVVSDDILRFVCAHEPIVIKSTPFVAKNAFMHKVYVRVEEGQSIKELLSEVGIILHNDVQFNDNRNDGVIKAEYIDWYHLPDEECTKICDMFGYLRNVPQNIRFVEQMKKYMYVHRDGWAIDIGVAHSLQFV